MENQTSEVSREGCKRNSSPFDTAAPDALMAAAKFKPSSINQQNKFQQK
jgi:hypothetical protein